MLMSWLLYNLFTAIFVWLANGSTTLAISNVPAHVLDLEKYPSDSTRSEETKSRDIDVIGVSSDVYSQLGIDRQHDYTSRDTKHTYTSLSGRRTNKVHEGINSSDSRGYHQIGIIDYYAGCVQAGIVTIRFIVDVEYNGYNFIYHGKQNMKFGATTIRGGRHGAPLISTAEFRHSICKAWTSTLMCRYDYFGVVTAQVVWHGSGIVLHVVPINSSDDHDPREPYVIETCASVQLGTRASCPAPGVERCKMSKVVVSTR